MFPTLLEIAGLPPDSAQEGQSLVPLMKHPMADWDYPALTSFGPGNYSVRSTRYRFIQYRDGSREFYDHQNDPHEWTNLAAVPEMSALIAEHAAFLPQREHALLPGNSTGHKAFAAANQNLAERRRPQKEIEE